MEAKEKKVKWMSSRLCLQELKAQIVMLMNQQIGRLGRHLSLQRPQSLPELLDQT